MNYFSGTVYEVIFENPTNGYVILKMTLDGNDGPKIGPSTDGSLVVAKGTVSGIDTAVGTWFGFEGRWVRDQRYGMQIEITNAPLIRGDWTPEVVASMLYGGNIGRFTVLQLYNHFGHELREKLDDVEAIQEVPGISPMAAMEINGRWRRLISSYQSLGFLRCLDLPKVVVRRVWTLFGDDANETLTNRPWDLVRVDGITFQQADKIACDMGRTENCVGRVRGALLYVCRTARSGGHLYLSTNDVWGRILQLIPECTAELLAEAIRLCSKERLLVVDRSTCSGTTAIYEPWFYSMEQFSAALLSKRIDTAVFRGGDLVHYANQLSGHDKYTEDGDPPDLREIARDVIREWGVNSKLVLGPEQEEGVLNALVEPVSIITGLPGTGKTTSVRSLVSILHDVGASILMVSPTGIAAKRLGSVTGAEAQTIHRAFEARGISDDDKREAGYVGILGEGDLDLADGSREIWGYGPGHPYPADLCVVDESSMVDQHLMYRILSCTSPTCRIVFIGDAAQLPSVGPGNALRDMISSGVVPTTSLTKIYRQEDTSDIVVAAHEIQSDRVPEFVFGRSKDFLFVEIGSEVEIRDFLVGTVERLYSKKSTFQTLSPKHSDVLGVTSLNQVIRERLNPKSEGRTETRVGSWMMREGDRVMVTKNNYNLGIFNGDTGKVESINNRDRKVRVKIHGPPVMKVDLPFRDVSKYLRLAYCVTIHKMQGLESNIIIMPFVRSFRRQLQRNLLYTAITRARKKVVMVGHREAFLNAIQNDRVDHRNTMLVQRIRRFSSDTACLDSVIDSLFPSQME